MTINPYTLNNLYNQGLLDYVPYDLCNGYTNVSALGGMQNPYLNLAKQGALYQQSGAVQDSFSYSNNTAVNNSISNAGYNEYSNQSSNPYEYSNVSGIGTQSGAGTNAWGVSGIGSQSAAGSNAWGIGGIGSQSNAGSNAWGVNGIGSQSVAGGANAYGFGDIGSQFNADTANGFGGFGDVQGGINGGINKISSFANSIPTPILGVLSGALIVGSAVMLFRHGKRNVASKFSFSKLNPLNWFSKKK